MRIPFTAFIKDTLYVGLVSGTLLGLFLSSQVLVLNGDWGPNRDFIVLSLYTIIPSIILLTFAATATYLVLSLAGRIVSREFARRRTTLILLLIGVSLIVSKSLWNWIDFGGIDYFIYALLAVLLTITLFGICFLLLRIAFTRPIRPKRDLILAAILLAVFTSTFLYYRSLWVLAVDPDLTMPAAPRSDRKSLVIGIDSANWHAMIPLLEKGLLPNIKGIMDAGVHGPLETIKPTASSIIWTSMITGKHFRKHGIDGFAYYNIPGLKRSLQMKGTMFERLLILLRVRKMVSLTPFNSEARICDTLWNIMSRNGYSVGVVNWMASWPIDEVDGFMISSRFLTIKDLEDEAFPEKMVTPSSLYGEAVELFKIPVYDSLPPFITALDRTDGVMDEYVHGLENLEKKVRLTISLSKKYDPDCILFYDHFLDSVQHRLWRFKEPDRYQEAIPREHVALYGGLIDYTYRYLDQAIGRLIREIGEGRDIFIVSDHGMEPIPIFSHKPTKRKRDPSTEKVAFTVISAHHYMAPPGIFIASGRGIRKGAEVRNATIYDITPTLLYLYDLPVAADMDGKVLEEILEPGYFTQHRLSSITTYETEHRSRERFLQKAETDKEVLEQFKALGYIE